MARNPRRTKRQRKHVKREGGRRNLKVNACGGCSVCCMVLKVEAVAKEQYTRCRHQCEEGCGIYRVRPTGCSGFHCLYELGMIDGGIDARPDKLGLLLYFQSNDFGDVVMINEAWSGALDANEELIEGLREFSIVILIPYGGGSRKVRGPDKAMQKIADKVNMAKARKATDEGSD